MKKILIIALLLLFNSLAADAPDMAEIFYETHRIKDIQLTPDGNYFYGLVEKKINLYETATMQILQSIPMDHRYFEGMHLTPDGRTLIAVIGINQPKEIFLIDTKTGVIMRHLEGREINNFNSMAISSDSRFMVLGFSKGWENPDLEIKIYDLETFSFIKTKKLNSFGLMSIGFNKENDSVLLLGEQDNKTKIFRFNFIENHMTTVFDKKTHEDAPYYYFMFFPDKEQLLAINEMELQIWNQTDDSPIWSHTFEDSTAKWLSVRILDNNHLLISENYGISPSTFIFNISEKKVEHVLGGASNDLYDIKYNKERNTLYLNSGYSYTTYNLDTNKTEPLFNGPVSQSNLISIPEKKQILFINNKTNQIHNLSVDTMTTEPLFPVQLTEYTTHINITDDARILGLSGSEPKLFNLETGEVTYMSTENIGFAQFTYMWFGPNNEKIYLYSNNSGNRFMSAVWDKKTDTMEYLNEEGELTILKMLDPGKTAIVKIRLDDSSYKSTCYWDLEKNELIGRVEKYYDFYTDSGIAIKHNGNYRRLDFYKTENDELLYSINTDGWPRIYDEENNILLTTNESKEIQIYDLETKERTAYIQSGPSVYRYMDGRQFTPGFESIIIDPLDNDRLIATMGDNSIRVWSISREQLLSTTFIFQNGDSCTWTPQGYYKGSDSSLQLGIGTRPDSPRNPLYRFAKLLNNPEYVDATLQGNELSGVENPALDELFPIQEKDIRIEILGSHGAYKFFTDIDTLSTFVHHVNDSNLAVDGNKIHVRITIKGPENDVSNIHMLNMEAAVKPLKTGSKELEDGSIVREFEVPLHQGLNTIQLSAFDEKGIEYRSRPVSLYY